MAYAIALDDAFHIGGPIQHTAFVVVPARRRNIGKPAQIQQQELLRTLLLSHLYRPQKQIIRDLAERLDAHRERQLQLHPWLTLTDMYNLLEKLRSNSELTEQDQIIYQSGLISILREPPSSTPRALAAASAALVRAEIMEASCSATAARM
jgi:hypothetical protein